MSIGGNGSGGIGALPLVCLADYESAAARMLDANAWAYVSGGAADEITMRWNREAFDRRALLPRVLASDPARPGHTRITLLARERAHPILVAPIAFQKLAHPDGELAAAIAAAAQDAVMVTSSSASARIEDIAAIGNAGHWFQLYMQAERQSTLRLLRRAEEAGCEAIVVTVDAPVNGVRNREHRAGFTLPPGIRAENLVDLPSSPAASLRDGGSAVFEHFMAQAPSWRDIAWLIAEARLPVLLKGILHPDDAGRAIENGAAGIIVSNHGGRTLDTAIATLDALPAIAERCAGRVPVLIDGGMRRGTDILKAISLGATAVLVGRPIIHGLAVAGAHGASHVLRLLRDELEIAMALTGVSRITEIGPSLLWSGAPPSPEPSLR